MLPKIDVFGFQIQVYGLLTLLGAIAAIIWCMYAVKQRRLDTNLLNDILIYAGIGALVGGKLLYLIVDIPWLTENAAQFIADPLSFLQYLTSGFVYYGGFIGLLCAVWLYSCRHPHVSVSDYLEACMAAIPLFHSFGRIGCFLAGCCYGEPANSILAIPVYTQANPTVLVSRYPVQLYEAFFNLMLFLFLASMSRRRRNGFAQLGTYLTAYGIFRFLIEFLRGDAIRGVFLLSTSQWISLILVPIGLWILLDPSSFKIWLNKIRKGHIRK